MRSPTLHKRAIALAIVAALITPMTTLQSQAASKTGHKKAKNLIERLVGFDVHLAQFGSNVNQMVDEVPLSAATCEPYSCNPSLLPANQCVLHKQGSNYLQMCPAGSFCPWALSAHSNTTCVQGSDAISYGGNPGDVCASNGDCGGLSFCNSARGVCQGYTTGHTCNDQPDCDVGYACHNVEMAATCQPLNTLGNTCGNYLTMNL